MHSASTTCQALGSCQCCTQHIGNKHLFISLELSADCGDCSNNDEDKKRLKQLIFVIRKN